jgi:hypothetical protein
VKHIDAAELRVIVAEVLAVTADVFLRKTRVTSPYQILPCHSKPRSSSRTPPLSKSASFPCQHPPFPGGVSFHIRQA